MSKDRSFAAVKKAIGGGPFRGKRNVLVNMGEITFLYKDVFVSATYNIAYMQMDIDVVWAGHRSNSILMWFGKMIHLSRTTIPSDCMEDTTVLSKIFDTKMDISAGKMAPLLYQFCFNPEREKLCQQVYPLQKKPAYPTAY